ncbi:redox-regulated ATPase YchF [Candidatus Woesearchaeota archaeon]|nr:redox-regulated ATPase YchF [Candidatus Woesearchaeota archaeon]
MLIGIVGKPSCGKSTFFKALTLAEVAIASYPFTTIKPNRGVGYVRVNCADRFFGVQCNPREGYCLNGERFVPVELLDVAGLVPGAHEGKGLGNQFLDDLRQAHVLIHIIDASGSTNESGEPVPAGSHDPARDIRFLENELDLWYLSILKKPWEKFSRQAFVEKKKVNIAIARQFSGLNATESMVAGIIDALKLDSENATRWSGDELQGFATELRRRTKPMIIAANKVDAPAGRDNFERLRQMFPEYKVIPCSAESELALKEAAKKGMIEYASGNSSFSIRDESLLSQQQLNGLSFIKESVIDKYGSTGVQETLNRAVFDVLKLIAVFPGGLNKLSDQYGRVLPDCFLMPPNSTSLDFAFRIHSDIGNSFIRAIDVKKRLAVGREHILSSGDVIEIVSAK